METIRCETATMSFRTLLIIRVCEESLSTRGSVTCVSDSTPRPDAHFPVRLSTITLLLSHHPLVAFFLAHRLSCVFRHHLLADPLEEFGCFHVSQWFNLYNLVFLDSNLQGRSATISRHTGSQCGGIDHIGAILSLRITSCAEADTTSRAIRVAI